MVNATVWSLVEAPWDRATAASLEAEFVSE
jgi:hypothetical protein